MRTRTINGAIFDTTNTPRSNLTLRFVLNRSSYIGNALVFPGEVSVVTDSDGLFSVTLWCNADGLSPTVYTCTIGTLETFRFQLPYAASAIEFDDLIGGA